MLGLSTPVNGPSACDVKGADNSNDIFGYFMSGTTTTNGKSSGNAAAAEPAATVTSVPSTANNNPTNAPAESSLAQQEHDFFNQVPNEKEKAKMTKDSILALYGQAPAAKQFMPGMQTMQSVDANGSLFGNIGMPMQQYQQPSQPSAFGMPGVGNPQQGVAGLNNFAQFGMMAPTAVQSAPQMNFQATHSINTMPNQPMGFSNVPSTLNPAMQAFNQANANKTNAFGSGANHASNVNNVNQQFGNLNLGNVWQ